MSSVDPIPECADTVSVVYPLGIANRAEGEALRCSVNSEWHGGNQRGWVKTCYPTCESMSQMGLEGGFAALGLFSSEYCT